MILSKGKCLIPLPINRNQDREQTLKIKDLVTIITELEREDIQIKFVTYHGEKPYLNFDDSSLIKEFITQHDELLSTVSNIDNVQVDNFDCLIIPSNVIPSHTGIIISSNTASGLSLKISSSPSIAEFTTFT